jgi:sporulation protein YlmC with PRC-barrel domain
MNKLIIASTAAALMMGMSTTSFAAVSAADCQTMFQNADVNKDGSLQTDEARVFLDAMNQAQVAPKDASMITQDEFVMACQKDAFANIDPATIGTGQSAATPEQPAASDAPAATAEQPAEQPAAAEAAQQPEQVLASPEGFMVSNLLGATIYSGNDENIGELKDVVFSEGQATHFIIEVEDRNVEVERAQLKIVATEGGLKVVMNATAADLAALPAVDTAPGASTDQSASAPATTTTDPAASTTTATDQSATAPATTEQPATTEEQAAQSADQSAEATATETTDQPAATEQPQAEQPADQSAEATATTDQSAATEQPQAEQSADQSAEATATTEQPAATEQPQAEQQPAAADQTASTSESTTTDTAAQQPAEQALAIPEGLMVSNLIGTTVYSRDDEAIGEINDMVLSPAAGQGSQVIIGIGGFLGIGEKNVAVDLAQLSFATTDSGLKIVMDASKADLENLPAFNAQ